MLHSHIKKLSQAAPRYVCPSSGTLRFNEISRAHPPLSIPSHQTSRYRITVIFHPINTRFRRKLTIRACFAFRQTFLEDRPIVDASRFRLDSSRTSFVEIVKVSRDTMNYSCRGDAKLRETFLRRGEPVSLCVCVRVRARVLVCSSKGYEGPGRGMNAGKHGIIERWKGRMKVCKKEKKG